MSRYATLKDVAREAGTTAATVSYVLSGKRGRYVSAQMKERVLAAVAATGYIKSSPASSLQGKRQGIIAVLVPQFDNQHFTNLMVAIESVVERDGYVLSISNTFDDPERERDIIIRMAQQRVDGFIVTPTTAGVSNTETIRKVGVPLVLVDRPLQDAAGSFTEVVPDNYRSGYLLGEHFGQLGHTRVAFLGWESGFTDMDSRRDGFWDGLTAASGSRQTEVSLAEEFSVAGGRRAAERALQEHPDVTAWCLGYNVPARGSIDYLREQDITPGERLSVGIIGSPDWATVGGNDFTLVDPRPAALGRMAAEQLLQKLSGDSPAPARTTIDCQLRVGSSTTRVGSAGTERK